MKVYIITYNTDQQDTRVGAVYTTLPEAKREAIRLNGANPFTYAGVVIRNVELPHPLTAEEVDALETV